MNMENFNPELYEKCVAASEWLFADMLADVAKETDLSIDTIRENEAKRLYNLALKSFWIQNIDIPKRISDHSSPDIDPLHIHFSIEFFDTIR